MKWFVVFLALFSSTVALRAAELLPIEKQVAEAAASSTPTVVHFWAPWCPNCAVELSKSGWATFINRNTKINFIFVTSWNGGLGDGRDVLAKYGVGGQKNFQLLLHPNGSRRLEDKMSSFLGLPMLYLPSTWIFRDGKLRYALNYGEVRFPVLQQLVDDAAETWER